MPSDDSLSRRRIRGERFGVFEARAGIKQDDRLIRLHPAPGAQAAQGGETRAAFGRGADTGRRAQGVGVRHQVRVGDGEGGSSGAPQPIQHDEVADGARHAQARRDRPGVLKRACLGRPRRESAGDGGAAFRLDADQARALRPDPAQRLHLVEGFPHADQPRSAAGGVKDHVGQRLVQRLGDLVAHKVLKDKNLRRSTTSVCVLYWVSWRYGN